MKFEYQVVPFEVTAEPKKTYAEVCQSQLQGLIDKYSAKGWEYYRMDQCGVQETPGCMGALLGQKAQYERMDVIIFRRTV